MCCLSISNMCMAPIWDTIVQYGNKVNGGMLLKSEKSISCVVLHKYVKQKIPVFLLKPIFVK